MRVENLSIVWVLLFWAFTFQMMKSCALSGIQATIAANKSLGRQVIIGHYKAFLLNCSILSLQDHVSPSFCSPIGCESAHLRNFVGTKMSSSVVLHEAQLTQKSSYFLFVNHIHTSEFCQKYYRGTFCLLFYEYYEF